MVEPAKDERKAVADIGRQDQKRDYLLLAWQLEQKLTAVIAGEETPDLGLRGVLDLFASQKDPAAIARDGQGHSDAARDLRDTLTALIDNRRLPDRGLQGVLIEAVTRNLVVSHKPASGTMNPGVWRSLPEELLQHIFARLPLQRINELQFLSKNWRDELVNPFSALNREITDVHPNLVTIVSRVRNAEHRVRIFDSSKNTWDPSLSYRFDHVGENRRRKIWGISEGFSLCRLVGVSSRDVYVFNLFTRVRHKLERLHLVMSSNENHTSVEFLHMKMNREAKYYTILYVVEVSTRSPLQVHVYDSRIKTWTREVPPFGFMYCQDRICSYNGFRNRLVGVTRIQFDSIALTLNYAYRSDDLILVENDSNVMDMAMYKDREFVLRKVEEVGRINGFDEMVPGRQEAFCILELQEQENGTHWVQVKTHQCPDFAKYCFKYECEGMHLLANDDILMVMIRSRRLEHWWHYNFSKGVWHELPAFSFPLSWSIMAFKTC